MLLSRAEAAQFLAKHLPIKTEPQWHTFLNDNARNRNSPKIKFKSNSGVGGKCFYKELDLMIFIENVTLPRHINRTQNTMTVYGTHYKENHTSNGRCLGWRDFELKVEAIDSALQDDDIVLQAHVKTGRDSDLRVVALTLAEAKEWLHQLTSAVEAVEAS